MARDLFRGSGNVEVYNDSRHKIIKTRVECPACPGGLRLVRDLHNENEDIWLCADCDYVDLAYYLHTTTARIIAAVPGIERALGEGRP